MGKTILFCAVTTRPSGAKSFGNAFWTRKGAEESAKESYAGMHGWPISIVTLSAEEAVSKCYSIEPNVAALGKAHK